MKSLQKAIGFTQEGEKPISRNYLHRYIKLKINSLGLRDDLSENSDSFLDIAESLIKDYRERECRSEIRLSPADMRIQLFVKKYFSNVENCPSLDLPASTFTLDFHGIARELSLPVDSDYYESEYNKSYRVKQGILHNPKNDKRTTKGVFHVVEGGLPIPDDKKAVPKNTAAYLFHKAFTEHGDILTLPFTAGKNPAKSWVSLLLRPIVCPEIENISPQKTMEIRFFAPGSLVSNLDFVESIFGNAGSPFHIKNDAALDIDHWTGHTGCIVLAPQLTKITKKEAGLPHFNEATDRQKRDGMCWKEESELYNDGSAFKLTFRDEEGIIITVIADNYFGYSKKEVKTQISYAANLMGNCEEEHAGGAFIFPSYNQGDFHINKLKDNEYNVFADVLETFKDHISIQNNGSYAIDKRYPNIYYVPETSVFNINDQIVSWDFKGEKQTLKLLPTNYYMIPNGSKFRMERLVGTATYRLVEIVGEGTLCHKPCTVSGGGKSEISKSISDSILTGSFFIKDFDKDMAFTEEILNYNYSYRFLDESKNGQSRSFLSPRRSMGSVIKLLSPSTDFTDEYNRWLNSIPQYIKGIAFIIKRFYQDDWGENWKDKFTVDIMNGQPGNELKYQNRKIVARYLRVGFDENGAWRTFKLRQDFVHAFKLQMEDDITASTVIPREILSDLNPAIQNRSVKMVENCEYRFFQRPDEAIHRGYDKKAEFDLAQPNTFISNFEPLTVVDAKNMVEEVVNFDKFTDPMRNLILEMAETKTPCAMYFVSSANPRLVNGKPSANVRYLQVKNELVHPIDTYLAEMGMRLSRKLPMDKPLYTPVSIVLPGRRNNPAEKGIRPLAVYNPVHYQELPELFMDFICSLTGKSPSTTGAGSEGALTKGPFNALLPITDLNNALISYILTGYDGFTTPAGYIGSKYRIDHDLSLLIPELWARLLPEERNPQNMIHEGFLEKINDFEYEGKTVKASVLGYRITKKFVNTFFGRVFETPDVVFSDEMLHPELQSLPEFVDGVNNITEAQQKVALSYFEDGSYELAAPPLKALLSIMAHGNYNGQTLESPEIREMFTYNYLMNTEYYFNRLHFKQQMDIKQWVKHVRSLEQILSEKMSISEALNAELKARLEQAKQQLEYVVSPDYLKSLKGTLGTDHLRGKSL